MSDLSFSLLDLVGGFFSGMAVLRYLLEGFSLSQRNPLMILAVKCTEFSLQWIRPVMAGLPGRDLSPLFWAWFLNLLLVSSHLTLHLLTTPAIATWNLLPWVAALAVVDVIRQTLYVWMAAVLLMAVLSWINPYHPLLIAVEGLVMPFLRVLRRFIPPLGRLDLTPVVLMVFFQFTLTVGVGALEMMVQRLM
ncbi:MAG: YggT family protein [Ferrovum sp.]|nr:YggT family protein [Ferrovum sp.]NDU87838.1 YggT family protein [Ferrovum sp.]